MILPFLCVRLTGLAGEIIASSQVGGSDVLAWSSIR
jgi:hypothetical protein